MKRILVIDGQGGKMGRAIVEALRASLPESDITAVGTNCVATTNMMKGGADRGATGENAVRVALRRAEIVVGPIGIVIADALLGEITPKIAETVGESEAEKILIPVNRCNHYIAGVGNASSAALLADAIRAVKELYEK